MSKILITIAIVLAVFTTSISLAVAQDITPVGWCNIGDNQCLVKKYSGKNAPRLEKVIKCESGWNIAAINKNDPNGGSKGLLQFQEKTFYSYAKVIEITNPDIWNPEQQIKVASYMFSKHLESHWSCSKMVL